MKKENKSDCINLGTSEGISVLEIIEAARRITGKEIKVSFEERREGDPPALIESNKKALDVLGWQPKYSDVDNIITTAWNWHKKINNVE